MPGQNGPCSIQIKVTSLLEDIQITDINIIIKVLGVGSPYFHDSKTFKYTYQYLHNW